MTVADILVGVVGEAVEVPPALVAAIEAAGAMALACTEAAAIGTAAQVDALVFDVGDAPERFAPVALSLASDPSTRSIPRVVIVAADTAAERLSTFGAVRVVPASSTKEQLTAVILAAAEEVRATEALEQNLRESADERHAMVRQLMKLREEAGTLAHDARVLFGVILGFAANLRDGIAGPVSEVQSRDLVNIVEASTDAAALLDRYLVAVRRTAEAGAGKEKSPDSVGRRPSRRRHVDLGELVRTTVALLGGVAAAKQIVISVDVAIGAPHVWCDPMQIKQALVNLLSNAFKFTPAGGAVDVEVRGGPPASARGGTTARREIELSISDTGPGIPVSERERVFARGVRLERDHGIPGTGIGLSVVRGVLERHGGDVRIEDAPGGGTSFVLTLPSDLRSRASDAPRGRPNGRVEDAP